ncbi:uncharacterized protein GGS25DRAFT_483262 [Hypoxylon fragiforme]|uniref:uncharacterized protein n=1 Tax=Hypoxylon fragiforme TaxID=63214 RepID=UPI0020C685D7|nr:uncharacterized protein GGS25DRAFT_483262 [Hypoxylon fragiforme]KAI2611564.1 hypothetical protein GGS25DRAFT_483262 [Hypoxylon fragiforme]
MTVIMVIAYPKDANVNMAYYLEHHLPAILPSWTASGMRGWRVLTATAAGPESPYGVVTEIEWPDMQTFHRAQEATPPEVTKKSAEDLKNYAQKAPAIWFMEVGAGA